MKSASSAAHLLACSSETDFVFHVFITSCKHSFLELTTRRLLLSMECNHKRFWEWRGGTRGDEVNQFQQCMAMQVLQKIRGTMEVEEELNDICNACEESNKVLC